MNEYVVKIKKIFPKRLNNLMNDEDISKNMLEKETGIQSETIQNYLNGKTLPNGEQLITLAKYFNVSASYLLGETDVIEADNIEINKILGIDDKTADNLKEIISINDKYENKYNDILGEIFTNPKLYTDSISNVDKLVAYYSNKEVNDEMNRQLNIGNLIINQRRWSIENFNDLISTHKFLELYESYINNKLIDNGCYKAISKKELENDIKRLRKELDRKQQILKKYN